MRFTCHDSRRVAISGIELSYMVCTGTFLRCFKRRNSVVLGVQLPWHGNACYVAIEVIALDAGAYLFCSLVTTLLVRFERHPKTAALLVFLMVQSRFGMIIA
jgi:hypothetical protein